MQALAERISDSELEVMKVLWEADDALPVTEIRTALQARRGWEATTVKTLVGRLVAKGALAQEKRNVYYYRPLIGIPLVLGGVALLVMTYLKKKKAAAAVV